MPEAIYLPVADTTPDDWDTQPPASDPKFELVNNGVATPDDSGYIQAQSDIGQWFRFPEMPANLLQVTALEVRTRIGSIGISNKGCFLGTREGGQDVALTDLIGVFAGPQNQWVMTTVQPVISGRNNKAAWDNFRLGYAGFQFSPSQFNRISEIEVTVTYTEQPLPDFEAQGWPLLSQQSGG